jgi:hypothetical protein
MAAKEQHLTSPPEGPAKENEENTEENDHDSRLPSVRENTAREVDQLCCHEQMSEFDDPTLFHRLIVPSAASVKRKMEQEEEEGKQKKNETAEPNDVETVEKSTVAVASLKVFGLSGLGPAKKKAAIAGGLNGLIKSVVIDQPPNIKKLKPPTGGAARPKKAPASSSSKKTTSTSAAGTVEKFAPPPPPYMYSWSSLELGTRRGSAAWNAILRQSLVEQTSGHPAEFVPQLTSAEILDILRCKCQLRTVLPPHNSPIFSPFLKLATQGTRQEISPSKAGSAAGATEPEGKSSFALQVEQILTEAAMSRIPDVSAGTSARDAALLKDDGNEDAVEEIDNGRKTLIRVMRDTYAAMVSQDALEPKQYYTSSAKDIRELVRKIENDSARMNARQSRVLSLSRQLGLATDETRAEVLRLRGVIPPRGL